MHRAPKPKCWLHIDLFVVKQNPQQKQKKGELVEFTIKQFLFGISQIVIVLGFKSNYDNNPARDLKSAKKGGMIDWLVLCALLISKMRYNNYVFK